MKHPSRLMRLLALFLSILTLISCVACGDEPAQTTNPTTQTSDTTTPQQTTPTTETTTTTSSENQNLQEPEPEPEPEPLIRPGQRVRIVDFNVLCAGSNLEQRVEKMIPYLLSFEADSIGLQEVLGEFWRTSLDEGLGEKYARVGLDFGGNEDTVSEFATYIYYLKDKYKVIDTGTFWLSTTPSVPSKYSNTVDCKRNCSWAIFENIETGFRYVHMNTHLDWMDLTVNVVQSQMIRDQMLRFADLGYPVFTTGDFNSMQDSISYGQITLGGLISDSKFVAEKSTDESSHPSQSKPIDFCFVTADRMDVLEYRVLTNTPDDVYVSDHKGIFVEADVYALPDQDALTLPAEFADGVEVEIDSSRSTSAIISFPQAKTPDGVLPLYYRIEMTDTQGNVIEQTVTSDLYLSLPPRTVTHTIWGALKWQETYHVRLFPVTAAKVEGKPLEFSFIAGEHLVVEEPKSELMLDLHVQNGVAVDLSDNAFTVETVGTVDLSNDKMNFDKTGNLKITGMGGKYESISDGFAMELYFKTPKKLEGSGGIASNQHAGGYACNLSGNTLSFSMHFGGYVGPTVKLEPDTEYHIVLVYDRYNMSIYVNGSLQATMKVADGKTEMGYPTADGAKYLCIGADSDASGKGEYPTACVITYVRVYEEALTEGNVWYLYEQTQQE